MIYYYNANHDAAKYQQQCQQAQQAETGIPNHDTQQYHRNCSWQQNKSGKKVFYESTWHFGLLKQSAKLVRK
jgi:predicted solute-binding protein